MLILYLHGKLFWIPVGHLTWGMVCTVEYVRSLASTQLNSPRMVQVPFVVQSLVIVYHSYLIDTQLYLAVSPRERRCVTVENKYCVDVFLQLDGEK